MLQARARAWRRFLTVALTTILVGASSGLAQSPYPANLDEPAAPTATPEPTEPAKASEPAAPEPTPAEPILSPEAAPEPVQPHVSIVRIYDATQTTTPAKPAMTPKAAPKKVAPKKVTPKKPAPKTSSKPIVKPSGTIKRSIKPAASPKPPNATVTATRPKPRAKPVVQVKAAAKPRPASSSVILERRRVLGKNVIVVRVNLKDKNVHITPVLPTRGLGKGASFDSLVRGSSAVAVINGGYFHPRTFSLAGDLVVKGKHVSSGRVRTTLGITKDNQVVVRKTTTITRKGWKEFETAIGNGPFILHNGKLSVYPKAEGYRDRAVWSSAARSAIGITKDGKMFFLSTKEKLNLYQLAKIMRALGAKDAITLDGGSSVGMAYRGKVMLKPSRSIAYGIGVYVTNASKTTTTL